MFRLSQNEIHTTIEDSAGQSGSPHPPSKFSNIRLTYHLHVILVIQISSRSLLVVCYIVHLLHQLRGVFRSRLNYTFERFRIPDAMSQIVSTRTDVPRKTYRIIRVLNSALGGCGFPSSSKAGSMLNVESTQAMTMYRVLRAKRLPGQALGVTSTIICRRGRFGQMSLTSSQIRIPYLQD